ncbi:MAG: isoprenylcysteine carboxylmethyltransferase family protein [Thermodesulfobacteriota bacterium]|nr:isoprenylcysteine carboxylmethyltransferase family protein [Thermodesulfobacteriota bacterium]
MDLKNLIALSVIIFWPVIPLFWIPVHLMTGLFKRLGLATLIFPIIFWLPLAYSLYVIKEHLLFYKITIPAFLTYPGWALFISGLALHILTGIYLRFGLIGIPEFSDKVKMHLVKKGPFAVVRHPTYLAHSMIFLGAFLITGILTVGLIAILDFFTVHVIIIPFEERELQRRFGDEYMEYKRRVPKFFPKFMRHFCI